MTRRQKEEEEIQAHEKYIHQAGLDLERPAVKERVQQTFPLKSAKLYLYPVTYVDSYQSWSTCTCGIWVQGASRSVGCTIDGKEDLEARTSNSPACKYYFHDFVDFSVPISL